MLCTSDSGHLDHGLLKNSGGIVCHLLMDFENNFVMHRPNNSCSGIRQSLGEEAQSLFIALAVSFELATGSNLFFENS